MTQYYKISPRYEHIVMKEKVVDKDEVIYLITETRGNDYLYDSDYYEEVVKEDMKELNELEIGKSLWFYDYKITYIKLND